MSEEGLRKTDNDLIHIGNPIPFDHDLFLVKLSGLMDVAYANKGSLIREKLMDMVSTYHPADAGAPIQSEGQAETEKAAS